MSVLQAKEISDIRGDVRKVLVLDLDLSRACRSRFKARMTTRRQLRILTWFNDPDGGLGRLPPALRLDPGPPRGVE